MSLEKNTANSSSLSTATTPWSLVSGLKQGVDKGEVSYQEVADQLHMGLNSVCTAIFRFRQRYARTFRDEITLTVGEEKDIDEEIRALLASLAPSTKAVNLH